MKARFTWALLGALSFSALACGPGSSTADTGDNDAATMPEGGTGGDAEPCMGTTQRTELNDPMGGCVGFTERACNGMPFCPAQVTNEAMRPQFVITQIDISTPGSLRSTSAVGNLLNNSIGSGAFLWGLDLDVAGGTLRTGAIDRMFMRVPGQGFLQQTLRFTVGQAPTMGGGMANRWDPVNIMATVMGDSFSTAIAPIVTVPVYEENNGPLLTELPLRNAQMLNVQMREGRGCIGLARPSYNSCLGKQWQTTVPGSMTMEPFGGRLEADISVADARAISIASLMSNLCNIVAGRNCEMFPQEMWPNQPDRRVGADTGPNNAWHVVANIAGVAVRIAR